MGQPTLVPTQSDLRLVSRADYLQAVKEGFRASARVGRHRPPLQSGALGGLHAKGAR